ncbi:MAG TPA: hypothetical protein VMW64_03505 [Dehalococcoidia bacterium]|nr:hypothetical protein [Dehalococcoidia bacterium]
MGAYEDLVQIIKQSEVMQQVLAGLQEEPVKIMLAICKEYEATNEPVADYHLQLSGYLGEIALRVLMSAGLIERQPGGRFSIFRYKPTSAGIEHYKRLIGETGGK